jgi:hypothetical protein
VLEACGVADAVGVKRRDDEWSHSLSLDAEGWDPDRRRAGGGGPDADTLSRVRGDKNRAMLLD